MVVVDLHSHYGINLAGLDDLAGLSWPYLQTRIVGLLTADTRLHHALVVAPQSTREEFRGPR